MIVIHTIAGVPDSLHLVVDVSEVAHEGAYVRYRSPHSDTSLGEVDRYMLAEHFVAAVPGDRGPTVLRAAMNAARDDARDTATLKMSVLPGSP